MRSPDRLPGDGCDLATVPPAAGGAVTAVVPAVMLPVAAGAAGRGGLAPALRDGLLGPALARRSSAGIVSVGTGEPSFAPNCQPT